MSDTDAGGQQDDLDIEEPYTVEEHVVHVQGNTDRPEVFIETRPESMKPVGDVVLLRDSDAEELYEKLGEYLGKTGGDDDE